MVTADERTPRPAGVRPFAFAGLALALLAANELGGRDPGGWVTIREALDHDHILLPAAGLSLLAALVCFRASGRGARLAKVGLIVIAVLANVALGLGLLADHLLADPVRYTGEKAAPDGRPYRVVVSQNRSASPSLSALSMRSGHGLLAREWTFACIAGDVDDGETGGALKDIGWLDATHVVVTQEGGRRTTVPVDGATGRPLGDASNWDGTCT